MASNPKTDYTPEEYLALERSSEIKHEYYNGEIFAMGGASKFHVVIVTNLVGELHSQLKHGPCNVYSNDMRVQVAPNGLYTYPDVIVLCEEPSFSDEQDDTLLNPDAGDQLAVVVTYNDALVGGILPLIDHRETRRDWHLVEVSDLARLQP